MNDLVKIGIRVAVMICCIPIALFIGKASINIDTWSFHIERPMTAMLFYATVLAVLIEEKY